MAKSVSLAGRLLRYVLISVVSASLGIALVDGFASRSLPELEPWHRVSLEHQFSRRDDVADFNAYLAAEEVLFTELEQKVFDAYEPVFPDEINRYIVGNIADPAHNGPLYNRSYELVPDEVKGAVVLLHGLSDSPYSLRHLGDFFFRQGFHVVVLRLPGHGTIPAGLLTVQWEDWAAATELAIGHAGDKLPSGAPLYLAGYSTGAALALKHIAADLLDDGETRVDRVLLFSPAIGVSPFAVLANFHRLISFMPYFEKSRWLDVTPEYDPYKYNSFTKNAGWQVRRLTRALSSALDELFSDGSVVEYPAVMAFASVVDDTVSIPSVTELLFDRLANSSHELVLFDFNHAHRNAGLVRPQTDQLVSSLLAGHERPYAMTILTNYNTHGADIEAISYLDGRKQVEPRAGHWPEAVFSLSHVALPFPASDPLYGADNNPHGLSLGSLRLKGERGVLMIPDGQLMRLRYNPFYGYIEERLGELVAADLSPGG